MMMGWIENFRREGFDGKDVDDAKAIIEKRSAMCTEILLLPAHEVPDAITLAQTDDILKKQILDMYGVNSLGAARDVYDRAMKP